MAVTEAYAGTETIGTTEWDLASDTSFAGDVVATAGVYQVLLELNNLAAGDVVELRVYEKVNSGSTQRLIFKVPIAGPVSTPNWPSPSIMLVHGWAFTLVKISGTDRSITWSIRKAG